MVGGHTGFVMVFLAYQVILTCVDLASSSPVRCNLSQLQQCNDRHANPTHRTSWLPIPHNSDSDGVGG